MEYTVAIGEDSRELSENVNDLIKEGFVPHGSMSHSLVENDYQVRHYYSQAMIKKSESK